MMPEVEDKDVPSRWLRFDPEERMEAVHMLGAVNDRAFGPYEAGTLQAANFRNESGRIRWRFVCRAQGWNPPGVIDALGEPPHSPRDFAAYFGDPTVIFESEGEAAQEGFQ